jgi:hypothetical protein
MCPRLHRPALPPPQSWQATQPRSTNMPQPAKKSKTTDHKQQQATEKHQQTTTCNHHQKTKRNSTHRITAMHSHKTKRIRAANTTQTRYHENVSSPSGCACGREFRSSSVAGPRTARSLCPLHLAAVVMVVADGMEVKRRGVVWRGVAVGWARVSP